MPLSAYLAPWELMTVHRINNEAGRLAMAKTFTRKAKHAIAGAAHRGAKNVKAVAGEALGSGGESGHQRTTAALASGRDQLARSTPAIKRAAGRAATNSVSKAGGGGKRRPRRKSARATRKTKRRAR